MIDEIYEQYEKRLSRANTILQARDVEKDINEIPLAVNVDIESILTPFDVFDGYDEDEIALRIREAYIEVFKEGIYLGLGLGKILKFEFAKLKPENYVGCLEEDAKSYTKYEFRIEVMNKIIPPIKVGKFTREENPKEVYFRNDRLSDIQEILCVNIDTLWEEDLDHLVDFNIGAMEDFIHRKEVKAYSEDEELKGYVDELKRKIQDRLFEDFFEHFDIGPKKAQHIGKNTLRFNEETAEDVFASELFSKLEGEFEIKELVNKYLIHGYNEGKTIGLLNGISIVIKDLQSGRLDYDMMNAMSSEESFKYIKEGLK